MFENLEKKYNVAYYCNDVLLVSYPKSGRTWLRMMLAKILKDMGESTDRVEMIPAMHKNPRQVYEEFGKNLKVIFLHRHPADSTISYYHEKNKSFRSGARFSGDVFSFLRDEKFGLEENINFNNNWNKSLKIFKDKIVISYEDLKLNPLPTLRKVVRFLNLEIADEKILDAIDFSSFDNMQKIERGYGENLLKNYKGNFGKFLPKGEDLGRVRTGKLNGFLEELNDKQIGYVNEKIKKSMLYSKDERS